MPRVLSLCAVLLVAAATHAQTDEQGDPDAALEAYLERLDLKSLMADQLELRLKHTPREKRGPIVERLGKLYVELLTDAADADTRRKWEERGEKLLAGSPDSESFELRLNLQKAVYFRAEEQAEKVRLRLTTTDEGNEAQAMMRELAQRFSEAGMKLNRRIDQLERAEAQPDAGERVAVELADARRLRSLAFYYAGWANVYLSMLSRSDAPATDALKNFGWLVGSSNNRLASVDKLQPAMLQYEHIARSAVGCAMAASLKGNDGEALKWLDLVEFDDQTSPAVLKQIPSRRLIVLAQAQRWYDVEILVRRMRRPDLDKGTPDATPLEPATARLLAVLTLEANKTSSVEQIERLSRTALGDLVAAKQTAQVMDLVERYGTASLGDAGFIVNFVRGAKAYEDARGDHLAASPGGTQADEPTKDAAIVNKYRAAERLLGAAEQQNDAAEFTAERARARLMRGRALYFAGDFDAASRSFHGSWELAGRAGGEESLWLAILSLERAVREAGASASIDLTKRLDEAVAIFLATYPESDKGARLVLIRAQAGDSDDENAIKVLLGVSKDSTIYQAARRQAARMLYNRFRNSQAAGRDFAAQRFVSIGEEVLVFEREAAMAKAGADSVPAAERFVLRARQLLDALLTVSTPDVRRAQTLLESIRSVGTYSGIDMSPFAAELAFRRMQIALATGDEVGAATEAATITELDPTGPYAAAGERAVYRSAASKYIAGSADAASLEAAGSMVKFGVRIIDRLGQGSAVLDDPAAVSLYSTVAGAAFDRWTHARDQSSQDLSMRLDKALLQHSPRLAPALDRLSKTAEAAGDLRTSLTCWATLLESTPVDAANWFEIKYHTIRVMAEIDPAKARQAMDQHRLLYPDLGPGELAAKFVELDAEITKKHSAGAASPAAPLVPAPGGEAAPAGGGAP